MLPEKGVPSAVVWTVRRWCLDWAAGPEENSTSEVQQLQKFCRRNCWAFAAPRELSAKCHTFYILRACRYLYSAMTIKASQQAATIGITAKSHVFY